MNTWDMIGEERAAFADRLDTLSDSDWSAPSLASAWTVKDVVSHMCATALMNPPKFFGRFIKAGFSFPKFTDTYVAELAGKYSGPELAALYRTRVNTRNSPPAPTASWLGETIIHGEDVTRALGNYGEHKIEHVVKTADFYKGSNALIGTKTRIAGVTLKGTDADWQHGEGPVVEGKMIAVLLAMTGRKVALDDLQGDGIEILRSR